MLDVDVLTGYTIGHHWQYSEVILVNHDELEMSTLTMRIAFGYYAINTDNIYISYQLACKLSVVMVCVNILYVPLYDT